MSVDPKRVEDLYRRVVEVSAEERAETLARECADDVNLMKRVEGLLSARDAAADGPMCDMTARFDSQPQADSADGESIVETRVLLGGASTDPAGRREPQRDAAVPLPACAGRYRILDEVARGGMGAVLRAHDAELDRTLAVKIMLVNDRTRPEFEERFLAEAQVTGQLQHPGIPPVHERGKLDDGRAFFAMKLIEGQTFSQVLAQPGTSSKDLPRFVGIFRQICQTIAYAHSCGVLHRDLKPANVMVGQFGEVQVMDWGLAKIIRGEGSPQAKTSTSPKTIELAGDGQTVGWQLDGTRDDGEFLGTYAGSILGTPAYMAPEQARGEIEALDERVDVFGLGAILCEILTGKPPFQGSTQLEVIEKAAQGDIQSAHQRLSTCNADAELVKLAKACLAPDKEERPRDADNVAQIVTNYEDGVRDRLREAEIRTAQAEVQVVEEQKRVAVEQQKRRTEKQRNRLLLSLATSLVVLIIGSGLMASWYSRTKAVRSARAQYLSNEVERALDDAQQSRESLYRDLGDYREFHKYLSDLTQWSKKLSVATNAHRRATSLIESDKEALVSEAHLQREKLLAEKLQEDRRHLQLAMRFDEIQLTAYTPTGADGGIDRSAFKPKFVELFRELGVNVIEDKPEHIATRIAELPGQPVWVAILDHWATSTQDLNFRDRLIDITRRIDTDPQRGKIRDPRNWDRATLEKLAGEIRPREQSPQLMLWLAERINYRGGDVSTLLRSAALDHPQDFWLRFALGNFLRDPRERIGAYQAAIAIRPASEVAHNNLGAQLSQIGQHQLAVAVLRRAVELNPNHAAAHYNLGLSLYTQKQFDDAIPHLRRAVELNPKYAKAQCTWAEALEAKGDYEGAIRQYQEALAIDSKYSRAHIGWGIVLDLQGNQDAAIEHYRAALRVDSRSHNAHANWAVALSKKGDAKGAIEHYRLAFELLPPGDPRGIEFAKAARRVHEESLRQRQKKDQ